MSDKKKVLVCRVDTELFDRFTRYSKHVGKSKSRILLDYIIARCGDDSNTHTDDVAQTYDEVA